MVDRTDDGAGPERREQLQTLGELLPGIAHEMTTPLGVLGSLLDQLGRCHEKLHDLAEQPHLGAQEQERMREVLAQVQQTWPVVTTAHDRLRGLVRELRLAGRAQDPGPGEPVPLLPILEGDLLLLQFELKQGVTVERRFTAEPTVRGHATRLGQVFLNLLRNAIQALGGQGTITLTVRQADGVAEVTVADDGPGIPHDLQDRLFTEPCTSKSREEGTGLGLVISGQIVRDHGGTIRADNSPDGGAVVTVTLPLA
jgi:signal transduction histidine kinase